jgi:hypothetical protein
MTPMRARRAALAVTGTAFVLVFAPPTLAATTTTTFTTAGEQVFTVPAAVTSLNVLLVGGNGGVGATTIAGGAPATVQGVIAVTPGEQLYVEVAGDGASATADGLGLGGTGGGGGGGDVFAIFGGAPSGAGGGGASDIRTCGTAATGCQTLASRLIVAGGGGGGGGSGTAAGGSGGAADTPPGGDNGQFDGHGGDTAGAGGGRATTTAGGAAGSGGSGSDGVLGTGGDGGTGVLFESGGGGGGGGVYGGGGGGAGLGEQVGMGDAVSGGGGGGGGSSGVPSGAAGVSSFSLVPTDNGAEPHVTLTWTLPPPAVVTGAATAVMSTSATINGAVNPDNSPLSSCSFGISPTPPAGASVSCAQQVPNGGTPVPVSAQLLGLKPSTTYTVALSAANVAGGASGSPVTFTTLTPVPAPVISKLRVAKRVHRLAGKHAKARKTIKLTLSEPAKLTFTFGRKRHEKFVVVRGTFGATCKAGANRIRFGGVLGRKRLQLGSYKLTVVATNASGGTSKPASAKFKLVR